MAENRKGVSATFNNTFNGRLAIIMGLSLILCAADRAFARRANDDGSGWRGVAMVESLAVYTKMSPDSTVVRHLKKGEAVKINLEITGRDGAWCSVTAIEDSATGYVQAEYIEKEVPAETAEWRYLPPPEPVDPAAEAKPPKMEKFSPYLRASKTTIRVAVEQFYRKRFGQTLPISAYGQTGLHSRMGFNHQNAFDVPLHPDGPEGKALIAFLREQGIPFIAFRGAVRGVSTGPHVHVGLPSSRR